MPHLAGAMYAGQVPALEPVRERPLIVELVCSGSRSVGKVGQSDTGGGFVAALRPVRIWGQASNPSIDNHQIR